MFAMITLVRGSDWEALYVNGELVDEGHRISAVGVLDYLNGMRVQDAITTEIKLADSDWLEDRGSFPDTLDEVVFV